MTDKLRCPACGDLKLHKIEVRNALSRYCDKYICSDCGTTEALEGDFWHSRAQFGTDEDHKEIMKGIGDHLKT